MSGDLATVGGQVLPGYVPLHDVRDMPERHGALIREDRHVRECWRMYVMVADGQVFYRPSRTRHWTYSTTPGVRFYFREDGET